MAKCNLIQKLRAMYTDFKRGLALNNKRVHKPFFIHVLRLFSDIADAARSSKVVERCAQNLEWDEELLKDIGNELKKVKQTRPSSIGGSVVPAGSEAKSCYEDLFKKLGSINYASLEDNLTENIPEEFTKYCIRHITI